MQEFFHRPNSVKPKITEIVPIELIIEFIPYSFIGQIITGTAEN